MKYFFFLFSVLVFAQENKLPDYNAYYPDGAEAWKAYIHSSTIQMVKTLPESVSSGDYKVKVEFYVETDGSLVPVKAICDPYSEEVGYMCIEIISNSALWQPAVDGNMKVRQYLSQPFRIIIPE